MTTNFPTAPRAYGLNGPSAPLTVEKSPHASHTEILTPPKAGSTFAAKYRDPLSGKTWTGRGKPPLWITEALKAGKKDDYLIDKPQAPEAQSATLGKQTTAHASKAKAPAKKAPKKVAPETVAPPTTESTPGA